MYMSWRTHEHQIVSIFQFFGKTSNYRFLIILSVFLCVSNPLLLQNKFNIKKFVYYENHEPFCETNNVWWNIYSTLNILCSNQNSKSKDLMVDFRFFNILVNHKAQLVMINMSLKEHHTCIHCFKCTFELDLTWFLAYCFMFLPTSNNLLSSNDYYFLFS